MCNARGSEAPLRQGLRAQRMKTKAVGIILFIAITLSTAAPANAGFVSWLMGTDAKAGSSEAQLSFSAIYDSVVNGTAAKKEDPIMVAGALAAPTSPSASRAVTVTYGKVVVQVSGYSSEVAQTDDSPFITAKGTYVRDGIVAANFLPFGTRIKIPSLYGDKIFVVEDRMNSRYWKNVDIWFANKADAIRLGRRTVTIEVIH